MIQCSPLSLLEAEFCVAKNILIVQEFYQRLGIESTKSHTQVL